MHAPDDARLDRLEEAAGFTDHRVDQLADEVREVFERVRRLSARLDALEHRLSIVEHPEPESDDDTRDPTMTEPT